MAGRQVVVDGAEEAGVGARLEAAAAQAMRDLGWGDAARRRAELDLVRDKARKVCECI